MSSTNGRRAVVITVSDTVSRGQREDRSGPAMVRVLEGTGFTISGSEALSHARDSTPEATQDVIERPAPGLAEAMRAAGRAHPPMAFPSRGVCGIRGRTLLLNLPGSLKGAVESLEAVLDLLPHALALLDGNTEHRPTT